MTELEAIKCRHSVRKYQKKAIEADKVELLNKKIDEINQLGKLHLQFIPDAGNTYNRLLNKAMGLGSAPSAIACVGLDDETLDERVGYYGQQLVLFAQQLGLNTCWVGSFNRNKIGAEILENERLVLSIAIGYGEHQGKERKSKTISQIADLTGNEPEWFTYGLEMALLAPTAVNQQSFEIRYNNGEPQFIDKGGVLSRVDLGIVKYNFQVGAEYKKC